MAKRLIIITSLLFALLLPLSAASSGGQMIDLDSGFYENYDRLATSLGVVANRTRPYTRAEAEGYLDDLASKPMDPVEKALYNELVEMVVLEGNGDETFNFTIWGSVNPQLFMHINTRFSDTEIEYTTENANHEFVVADDGYSYSRFNLYSAWPTVDVKDFADVNFTVDVKDFLSFIFELPIANVRHTKTPFGSREAMSNIPMLADFTYFSYEDFCFNFPYRAHVSGGGDWWSFLLGREKLDYGGGISGNFGIDRHLDYHNALTFSLFGDSFKYTYLLSFFPHPSQYLDLKDTSDPGHYGSHLAYNQKQDAFTGTKAYVSHRFEWTSSTRRNRLALTEAVMYVDDGGLDFQFLNPITFLHNLYVAGNSNSQLTLEWEYVFMPGLKQNLAIIIDDLDVPGESASDGDNTKPSALGIQLSLSSSNTVGDGILSAFGEVTFTTNELYLYLREDANTDTLEHYPIDFTVALRNMRTGTGVYDVTYLGYPYGGGVINLLFGLDYNVPDLWSAALSFNYIYKSHTNPFSRVRKLADDPNKADQHSFIASLNASWKVNDNFTFTPVLSYLYVANLDNVKDNGNHDVQLMIGGSYTF